MALLPPLGDDPSGELRQTTMALQHVAERVLRLLASMQVAARPSWTCHWQLKGRPAWHRRDHAAVRRAFDRLPDHSARFLGPDGLLDVFPEARFEEVVGRLMHTILMSKLAADASHASSEDKARALRARFHRRLAAWSPRRRIAQSMIVLGADGAPLPTIDTQADALARHWGQQFSETRGVDMEAVRSKLQHCTMLPMGALRMLDFEAFDALFDHLPHSALGPDGLSCACWSVAGPRARRTLFEVYCVIVGGAPVLAYQAHPASPPPLICRTRRRRSFRRL